MGFCLFGGCFLYIIFFSFLFFFLNICNVGMWMGSFFFFFDEKGMWMASHVLHKRKVIKETSHSIREHCWGLNHGLF